MSNKPEITLGNNLKPLDFWLEMFRNTDTGQNKVKRFAEDFGMLSQNEGGGGWILDAIIMLCENFKQASRGDTGSMDVYDFADTLQRELFKWTHEFEVCEEGYRDYLKLGVRDYHHKKEDAENVKLLKHLGAYISEEPERRKTLAAKFEAERQTNQKSTKEVANAEN